MAAVELMHAYDSVIFVHARRLSELYPDKIAEIERISRLSIAPDGSNNGSSKEDAARYLEALSQVTGSLVASVARLAMFSEAVKLDLDPDF